VEFGWSYPEILLNEKKERRKKVKGKENTRREKGAFGLNI
jgi:hypothetical protein